MAEARVRYRNGATVYGSATRGYDGYTVHSSYQPLEEECHDIVGNPRGDNPFVLTRRTIKSLSVNSDYGSGVQFSAADYSTGFPQALGHNPSTTTPPPDAISIADAIGKSNPSRPYVDLPVTLVELRDLPRAIKRIGDFLTGKSYSRPTKLGSDVGSDFLSWTFGWAPLISDLRKLLSFQDAVDKRIAALNKLSESGLHRKITVWEDSSTAVIRQDGYLLGLYGNEVTGSITRSTERHRWVSVRWEPNPIYWSHDPDVAALARRVALGLNLSFATVWELMPWSWLIDWFSNIGDILEANRGSQIATPSSVCVMQETRSIETVNVSFSAPRVSLTGGTSELVSKTRAPASAYPLPSAYLPILTGKQVSILSALAVTRLG